MDFPLFEYSKKHPQGVIVALLGIIIVGSVAGGLWIQNLRSSLEEKEKIFDARIRLTEERLQKDIIAIRRANTVFMQQAEVIKKSGTEISSQLPILLALVKDVRYVRAVPHSVAKRLEIAISESEKSTNTFTQALMRSLEMAELLEKMELTENNTLNNQLVDVGAVAGYRPVIFTLILIAVVAFIGICVSILIFRLITRSSAGRATGSSLPDGPD